MTMILNFDFHSDVPIFMQIRNQIVIGIAEGKLKPGEQLPTIRALADESGINMIFDASEISRAVAENELQSAGSR